MYNSQLKHPTSFGSMTSKRIRKNWTDFIIKFVLAHFSIYIKMCKFHYTFFLRRSWKERYKLIICMFYTQSHSGYSHVLDMVIIQTLLCTRLKVRFWKQPSSQIRNFILNTTCSVWALLQQIVSSLYNKIIQIIK